MWATRILVPFALSLTLAADVHGQAQTNNLTPDGYWHNRYHSLLSMAGAYNETCTNQTFTQESELRNFPDSTRPPWQVINTFGPTPSGCEGFTVIVPEMNKALIVFKGNYELEQNISTEVVGWDYFGMGNDTCYGCTVNKFAAQGYMECKNETNDWKDIIDAYSGQKLVFSITGHGLGGMHSLIASADLNNQKIAYYSHTQSVPRTFNQAGARHYNYNFNGEAGERAIAGNDIFTESIPAGPNYAHAGTPFYYYGLNTTTLGMYMEVCWSGTFDSDVVDDPACEPRAQVGSTSEQDKYFYFTPVGQCGKPYVMNTTDIDSWISATVQQDAIDEASSSAASSASVAASSSSVVAASLSSVSAASASSVAATAKPVSTDTGAAQATGGTGSSSSSRSSTSGATVARVAEWVAVGACLLFGAAVLA
ncbi:hypothetical protein RQP46_002883 [Phenoliferia psychrophenolica]